MATTHEFLLPSGETHWQFEGSNSISFCWDYDSTRENMISLYDKGKRQQWEAATRINWSQFLDPENPASMDDRSIPIFDTPLWRKLSERERANVRRHHQAYTVSQFLHGEQGALISTAKIVQTVPDIDAKFCAATQVIDEARHVEVFSRLLSEKFEISFPIAPALKSLLEAGLGDRRWDMTYLTMQVIIEGLALASFEKFRDLSGNPLIGSLTAYVMQDEARHIAFGRSTLKEYYPHLSDAERREREEFVVDGCNALLDGLNQREVWERLNLPAKECVEATNASRSMRDFRMQLLSRVLPTLRDIGLWSDTVKRAFQEVDVTQLPDGHSKLEADELIAAQFDNGSRQRRAEILNGLSKPRR